MALAFPPKGEPGTRCYLEPIQRVPCEHLLTDTGVPPAPPDIPDCAEEEPPPLAPDLCDITDAVGQICPVFISTTGSIALVDAAEPTSLDFRVESPEPCVFDFFLDIQVPCPAIKERPDVVVTQGSAADALGGLDSPVGSMHITPYNPGEDDNPFENACYFEPELLIHVPCVKITAAPASYSTGTAAGGPRTGAAVNDVEPQEGCAYEFAQLIQFPCPDIEIFPPVTVLQGAPGEGGTAALGLDPSDVDCSWDLTMLIKFPCPSITVAEATIGFLPAGQFPELEFEVFAFEDCSFDFVLHIRIPDFRPGKFMGGACPRLRVIQEEINLIGPGEPPFMDFNVLPAECDEWEAGNVFNVGDIINIDGVCYAATVMHVADIVTHPEDGAAWQDVWKPALCCCFDFGLLIDIPTANIKANTIIAILLPPGPPPPPVIVVDFTFVLVDFEWLFDLTINFPTPNIVVVVVIVLLPPGSAFDLTVDVDFDLINYEWTLTPTLSWAPILLTPVPGFIECESPGNPPKALIYANYVPPNEWILQLDIVVPCCMEISTVPGTIACATEEDPPKAEIIATEIEPCVWELTLDIRVPCCCSTTTTTCLPPPDLNRLTFVSCVELIEGELVVEYTTIDICARLQVVSIECGYRECCTTTTTTTSTTTTSTTTTTTSTTTTTTTTTSTTTTEEPTTTTSTTTSTTTEEPTTTSTTSTTTEEPTTTTSTTTTPMPLMIHVPQQLWMNYSPEPQSLMSLTPPPRHTTTTTAAPTTTTTTTEEPTTTTSTTPEP